MKLNAVVLTTVAFVLAAAAIGAALYQRLPAQVPTHFDIHGRADDYTAKPYAVLIAPGVLLLTGLLFSVLPRISPKGYRLEPFLRVYEIIAITVFAVEFVALQIPLLLALGYRFDIKRSLGAGTGLLLLILGNYLGKVTRNFFVGIRTPWTLANEEVWLRTHRLGGVLFVIGGAVILIASFVTTMSTELVILGVIGGLSLFLVVYSYVIYRRIES